MWLNWILYALLLGLPFEYYFFGRQEPLQTTLKVQLGIFLAAWAAAKLRQIKSSLPTTIRELLQPFSSRFLIALLFLVCTQAAAAAAAPEFRGNAAKAAIKTLLGAVMLLATANVLGMGKRQGAWAGLSFRRFLACLSLAGLLTSLAGFLSEAGIPVFRWTTDLFQPQIFMIGGHARFSGTMEYPNTAASFLATALLASISLALPRIPAEKWDRRCWWLVPAGMQTAALILTYSRGAAASVAIAILAATLVLRKRLGTVEKRLALTILAAVALGGIIGVVASRNWQPRGSVQRGTRSALYGLQAAEEIKHLVPDRSYYEILGVRNSSGQAWRAGTYGIGARWYDFSSATISDPAMAGTLQRRIEPNEELALNVAFRAPSTEGDYLLIWYLLRQGEPPELVADSYSPAVVCSVRTTNQVRPQALSRQALQALGFIRQERRRLATDFMPQRIDLWLAALRMFRQRPLLGVGPDNFRLLKWRYMSMPQGDETFLAHSLYLEFLAGSGILGLISLAWFLWEVGRKLATGFAASAHEVETSVLFMGVSFLAMFLAHGCVDYFLKFTPTFIAFWTMAGLLAEQSSGPEAAVEDWL